LFYQNVYSCSFFLITANVVVYDWLRDLSTKVSK
jgi:hypothetical protein